MVVTEVNGDCGISTSRRRFLRNAFLAASGMVVGSTPASAGSLALISPPSIADQRKIGHQAARQILQKYKAINDARAVHFRTVGDRLVDALSTQDRKNWPFRFYVVESDEVNALALPGGPLFLFTGLYEHLASYDALAALTSHQMTHIRLQHWAKTYAKEQEREIGIPTFLSLLRSGNSVQTFASLADSAIKQKYSREEERQADEGGLRNMVDAGYNPQGMLDLFNVLMQLDAGVGAGGKPICDFLRDHPLTPMRVQHAQSIVEAMSKERTFPALTALDYVSLRG